MVQFSPLKKLKFASSWNISWKFRLTGAPWYGAFRERLVSIAKCCLKKSVDKAYSNFYELQIVLSEIELILKSSPLNQLCDDDTSDILTPNHLLFWLKFYQINPNFEHSYEDFKSICQNVLNISKIQLNIFGKDGEQNMSRHWENINYMNWKPKQYQAKMIWF